ncbi:retrovirus-related pol polyprotein from transposon TNT 1-94 [Tanacetum coccineum]
MVNIRARLILSIRELAVHVPENLSRGSLNESFLIKVQYSYCNQLILMDQRNKRSGWTIGKAYRTIVKAKRDRKFGLAGRQMLRRVKSEISTRGDEYRCYLSTHCCIIFLSGERAIVGIVWSTCTRQYCMDRNEVIMSADLAIGIDPGAIRALTYNTWGDLSLYPRRMVMHVDIDVSRVYLESVLTQIDVGHVTRMQSYWVKGCIYIYYVIIEILSHGVSGDFLKRVGGMREQYAWEETPMHLQKDDVYWVARAVPDRLLLLGGGGGASRATDFSGIDARFVGQLIRDMVFYVVVSTKGTINNVCVPPVATSDLREYTFMCMLRRQSLRRGLYHTVRSDSDHSQSCDTREHMDCMFLLISMRWKAEEHVARVECVMLKSNKRVENIARYQVESTTETRLEDGRVGLYTREHSGEWWWITELEIIVMTQEGNPQLDLQEKGVINSRFSRHMTGNKSYLSDYEEIDGGFVAFGGDLKGGKITGKDTECVVLYLDFKLLDENHVLLRVPRKDNMYSVDLKNIVPPGDLKVKVIRCNNGTKFKNKVMNQFCEMKGIKREFSIARTSQQNGVAKRKNRTLIKAARTMLADSKLPTTFWAEAVNTAYYVQNRVLVIKPYNKTPYELFLGRKHVLRFMRPFGCPVTILNTIDHLGKFDGKADEGFFVGYSTNSKALRVFNSKTRIVEENLHVKFIVAGNQSNGSVGTKACDDAGKARMETVPSKDYILLPLLTQDPLLSSSSKDSSDAESKPSGEEEKKDAKDPENKDILSGLIILISGELLNGELLNGELLNGELLNSELLNSELLNSELLNSELLNSELLNGELPNSGLCILLGQRVVKRSSGLIILLHGGLLTLAATVDACNTANEMWIAIERLQQGESLNVQDVKTNLFWEFGKFTSRDGESMESYYSRFYKLMNELTRNNLQVTTMQVNVQFLQQLQPEWSRFVTIVKQSEKIDIVSYHRLFDILKQFQLEVNDIRAERIAKSANPLALIVAAQPYSDNYYQALKPQRLNATSSSTRPSASTRHKGKEIAKPITPQSESVSVSDEDSDPEQAQRDKEMQKNLALLAKYFKKLYKPTNNNLRTSSNSRNKTEDTTPRYNNDSQSRQFGNQRTMTVAGARETVGSQVVQQTGIQCFNCKGYGHYAKECRKPKRVKDYAYHKEKMMMCKQAEQGVPLQAEQADWLEDTDEEIDEQELEAHYSYMEKIQEVLHEESSSTGQPLEQVDQNAVECVDERDALANLIANLTLDTEENKTILKQLKKANASLTQELEKCKTNLDETNSALGEAISCRDSCLIALQNKQNEFEKYKAFNDRTIDYEILQTKLNETLGLLALKDIEIKEGLKTKAYEISVLDQKHDDLVKKSLLTKSQLEGYLKENTKVISDLKVKEEKDIDKMIEMDKQLKFLNEIVYTRNQSIQTIHMLAPKCSTYNGRPTFANPRYLKKAQSEKPCLYEIPYDKGLRIKKKVKIKGEKKEALLTLRQKPGQYICCQES